MCCKACKPSLRTPKRGGAQSCTVLPFSFADVKNGDIGAIALMTYNLNAKGVLDALRVQGINLDSSTITDELLALGELSKLGLDLKGYLEDEGGNPLPFNFSQTIRSVRVSKRALLNLKSSSCE